MTKQTSVEPRNEEEAKFMIKKRLEEYAIFFEMMGLGHIRETLNKAAQEIHTHLREGFTDG